MKKQNMVMIIVCGAAITAAILGIMKFSANRKENKKVSVRPENAQKEKIGKKTEKKYLTNRMEEIPFGYFSTMKKGGKIEKITYSTKDYTNSMKTYKKDAMVYIPYGYDDEDATTKYDIIYLMHGGGDDETWFFGKGDYDTSLKSTLDHMIANGDLPPCIVCTPTYQNPYSSGETESIAFFPEEFTKDLIPVVEERYHTYYDKTDITSSRWHRAFCGFSMGAATTWWVFEKCMNAVANFMPISGDSWCGGGDGDEKVKHLTVSVEQQGYSANDFLLFYGCGDEGDLAYSSVTSQVESMKKKDTIFQYCKNFTEGNFYFQKIKDGGHDINTVSTVVYSGLQRLFQEKRLSSEYYSWAEKVMTKKEPTKVDRKNAEYEYGKLKKYSYYSSTAKRKTNVNILLPPYYTKDKKYPVLYLLHGYFDNEDWMTNNNVSLQTMLGNLIATGEAEEMIVVMPYIFCNAQQKECTEMNLENSLGYDNFVNDLTTDLMPFVEEHFSVASGRENTAITGFSMGGREAIFIGMTHSDLFGYVGGVCPAPGLTPGSDKSQHPGQLSEDELIFPKNQDPYLFLVSAAENDSAVGNYPENLHIILEKNKVNHLWNPIPTSGHDASSVRTHLYNNLRMVFRYKK